MAPSSSGQDAALSRRKQGFDSPWGYHYNIQQNPITSISPIKIGLFYCPEVRTKYSKTFTTFFFPAGNEILEIVSDWVSYLREEKFWGNDDPLFPMTKVALRPSRHFEAVGLDRKHWSSATAIRKIFKEAFEGADLPYFNPHSFRNTLVRLGETVCQNPEEFKAWSQNLGHEKVMTTFYNYGEVENQRQGEIIRNLANPKKTAHSDADEIANAVVKKLQQKGN